MIMGCTDPETDKITDRALLPESFPDDFKLLEDDRHSYKQLGNCVNVNNVTNVIESTLKMYNNV